MNSMNPLFLTDGYKLGHHNQYPENMSYLFSNFTARSNKNFKKIAVQQYVDDNVVVFGTSAVATFIYDTWNKEFFDVEREEAVSKFEKVVRLFLNDSSFSADHFRELHDLGYLPVVFHSLSEGSLCPIGVPFFTIESNHKDFAWLVNYLETQISAMLWKPVTTATVARHYKKILKDFYVKTGSDLSVMDFMVHDFSMRGLSGVEDAAFAGMGHLTSFMGSDNIPAFLGVEKYYDFDITQNFLAGGVPATEHSVTSSNIQAIHKMQGVDLLSAEKETISHLMKIYPSGFLSYVSDTYDYFGVLTDVLPALKNEIMGRDGRLVVRPDTGNPADIVCGDMNCFPGTPEFEGTLNLLWKTFGGSYNEKGYKVLDSHIGIIYGDSITPRVMYEILDRMEQMGFAASNVVFGAGSFTYQYLTRDTFGMAMKATYCVVDGVGVQLFKDPKTGDGTKKSAKGMFVVVDSFGGKGLVLVDELSKEERENRKSVDCLVPIEIESFNTIRERVNDSL